MVLVDFTHPDFVPALYLPHDRRSPAYYVRLDELPPTHRFYSEEWALFRYPEWLEGGSAWMQALALNQDLLAYGQANDLMNELVRPVVGSADPSYDEALAQCLRILGYAPLVADVIPRDYAATDLSAQEY